MFCHGKHYALTPLQSDTISIRKAGGKGGLVPFILAFISTFGTLGVKVALLKMMVTGTKGNETICRAAVWAACCLLPQLVVAVIALSRAFCRS